MKLKFKQLVILVVVIASFATMSSAGAVCINDVFAKSNISLSDILSWSGNGNQSTCDSSFLLKWLCSNYSSNSGNSQCQGEDCEQPVTPEQPAEPEIPADSDAGLNPGCGSNPGTGSNSNTGSNPGSGSNSNTGSNSGSGSTANSGSSSSYISEVVRLVNVEREKNGLSALTENSSLSAVAQAKSQDMKDNNYFSHTSPTYGSPFDMMKQFGISYNYAGENIAMGYSTPAAVVTGWMNSEGHRANILNANYTQIGVGYVSSGHYWTQMFIG